MKVFFVRAALTAVALLCVAALGLAACKSSPRAQDQAAPASGGSQPAPSTASSNPPPPRPAPSGPSPEVSAQLREGAGLYAANCAQCHGASGQGGNGKPALIGAGALPTNPPAGARVRTGAFRTAMDIGLFIKNNMPPGSHTAPAIVGPVLAYLLASNGVTPSQPVNPSSAGSIPWNR
jgi:mono/diheme cytochrome c family protein